MGFLAHFGHLLLINNAYFTYLKTFLASFLPVGSISWLYYADRLMQLPLALIAIAVSTVILPHLSKNHSEGDSAAFNKNFSA